jgi:AhpD family alkylhydroperoxidase
MAEDSKLTELPEVLARFAQEYPEVWFAYNQLGKATAEAGPLDEKTQRLIKLAVAIGAQRQGAVHSHTRRALTAGLTPEELTHVGLLAISTIGWPGAFAAICWVRDIIARRNARD